MKVRTLVKVSGIAAAFAATFVAGAWAQAQTQHIVWKWPMSMEAVNAAPNIHHILFENGEIRLLEVTIKPGETEPMHGHMYPSVFAYNAVQPALTDHTADATTPRARQYEDIDWSVPQCRTMPIQAPHQVTNTDSFPLHFYRLEFKKMDGRGIETNSTGDKH